MSVVYGCYIITKKMIRDKGKGKAEECDMDE